MKFLSPPSLAPFMRTILWLQHFLLAAPSYDDLKDVSVCSDSSPTSTFPPAINGTVTIANPVRPTALITIVSTLKISPSKTENDGRAPSESSNKGKMVIPGYPSLQPRSASAPQDIINDMSVVTTLLFFFYILCGFGFLPVPRRVETGNCKEESNPLATITEIEDITHPSSLPISAGHNLLGPHRQSPGLSPSQPDKEEDDGYDSDASVITVIGPLYD
ncbi:hypothetical protein TWF730_007867 [Orbilia blumenaviensis]|uniref:Uncharacterized protein n=1 Tax=Orbilia blumenaviensis TaxID=1796055 RepID=A0AAV9V9S4_9PEZI